MKLVRSLAAALAAACLFACAIPGAEAQSTIYDYSTTPANNASVGDVNFAEGQTPGTLNDSARALMADVARWRDGLTGVYSSFGAGAVYAITTGEQIATYPDGLRILFQANRASTGAQTISIDGLPAKDMLTPAGEALTAGDILTSMFIEVVYDADADNFRVLSILPDALSPTLSAFSSVTGAADRLPYFTGASSFATTNLTPFGRTLIGDSQASIARQTLGLGGLATLSSIDGSHVANDSLTALDIGPNAVGNSELNTNSVNSASVVDNSITAADLAPDSVGASELASASVGSDNVINETLTQNDLGPNSVSFSEIVNGSVGTNEVADNSLTADDLGVNSVGLSEMADNAVGSAELIDNSITATDLAANSVSQGVNSSATFLSATATSRANAINTAQPDSKVLILGAVVNNAGSGEVGTLTLRRGATVLRTWSGANVDTLSISYVDAPGSAASHTYTIETTSPTTMQITLLELRA